MMTVFRWLAGFAVAGTLTGLLVAGVFGSAQAFSQFLALLAVVAVLVLIRLGLRIKATRAVARARKQLSHPGINTWVCRLEEESLGALPELAEKFGSLVSSGQGLPPFIVTLDDRHLCLYTPYGAGSPVTRLDRSHVWATFGSREGRLERRAAMLTIDPHKAPVRLRALATRLLVPSGRATKGLVRAVSQI